MQVECQFSDESCTSGSTHFRKVISHIFGRNKKCTIGIPKYVWIHFCRKHYQRARYRTNEWPFKQCELALDTVSNMKEWRGVQSFDLRLRRREARRTSGGDEPLNQAPQVDDVPVESANQAPPTSVFYNGLLTPPPSPDMAQNGLNNPDVDTIDNNGTDALATVNTETGKKKKKPPTIVPRPAPTWLHARVGPKKTFKEIKKILEELHADLSRMSERGETPHFPDIEILPNLYPGTAVLKSKKPSRISDRGAIKKPMSHS